MLTDRLRRRSTSKRKNNQIKAWYELLGTEILSYEDSLDSLASNLSYN